MEFREKMGLPSSGPVHAYVSRRPRKTTTREPSKKEGHDALIESLRHKNTRIYITSTSGETFTGRLNQSDRFTISFTQDDDDVPTIFFKSAIESFKLDVQE